MLPRRLRLTRPQDFEAVRRRGDRWREPLLTVHALPNGLPHNRLGFVVGRQVGSAVIRNQVKRWLRAAASHWLPEAAQGYDLVVTAQPSSTEATYKKIEAALGNVLCRAELIRVQDEEAVK